LFMSRFQVQVGPFCAKNVGIKETLRLIVEMSYVFFRLEELWKDNVDADFQVPMLQNFFSSSPTLRTNELY
jgi:hypothetical protein